MPRLFTLLTIALIATPLTAPALFAQPEVEQEREILRDTDEGLDKTETTAPQTLDDYFNWDKATGNWWGARTWLEDRGIYFNASLVADV